LELKQQYIIPDETSIYKKELPLINLFWIGVIIYTLAFAAIKGFPSYAERLQLVQLISILVCIPAGIGLIRFRIGNNYLKFFYIIYCAWMVYVVLRGISFSYDEFKKSVSDADYGLLIYFVPVVVLFPKDIVYLKKIFKVIIFLGVFFVLYCFYFHTPLLNPEDDDSLTGQGLIEVFSRALALPCGFILLTYIYHSPKRRYLALFVIVLGLLLALIRARRGLVFFQTSFLLIWLILFFSTNKRRLLSVVFSLLMIAIIFFLGFNLYNGNKPRLLNRITERIDEDTRSGVEECFFDDMKTRDWLIGRGMNGKYLCPGVDNGIFTDYREVIETGYLNIILKEGVIGLGLLLLITLPASIKGIFFSKNLLSRAAGIWILFWLIGLYPATLNNFNLNYLLVWISVGICYSPSIRRMPPEKVMEILSYKRTNSSFSR
jgi:hypothetical protein